MKHIINNIIICRENNIEIKFKINFLGAKIVLKKILLFVNWGIAIFSTRLITNYF